MSSLSIHPLEYLRLHAHYEEIRTLLLEPVRSFVKKIFESSDQAAAGAAVLLIVSLFIFACMKMGESALFVARYNSALAQMVFPLVPLVPTGM